MTSPRSIRVVVDRREGATVVLVDDHGGTYDIPASALPRDCRREGAILDVPLDARGEMDWASARRNRDEEQSRLREARDRLDRLRRTDPGGDVEL